MAYYLTLDRRGKEPILLDIDKSKYFSRISRYKGNKASIEEMDVFTMMFSNEQELRKALILEEIIPLNEWDKPISIRRKNGDKFDKVMYDILYQKDLEYFMNPEKLIARINNKLLTYDFTFIDEYVKYFRNFRDCSSTLPEVRNANNESIRTGMRSQLFDIDILEGTSNDNLLVRMTKLLIYKYYQTNNGNIIYKDEIKYLNFHRVLAFVNNYDNKDKSYEVANQMYIPFEDTKKRIKKKSNHEIEGQSSLFD